MTRSKIVVIGFHGGGPHYIQPLLDAGRLPTLQRLNATGLFAPADSTWPLSAACWVTFLTGLDVAQHGVLDVCENDARWFPSQSARPVDARAYSDETMFSMASRHGRSVAALGVPMTAPTFPVNGVLLSSFPVANECFPPTFPPNLLESFGPVSLCSADQVNLRDLRQIRAYLDMDLDRMGELGRTVYHSRDWDLFLLVFKVPDLVNHLLCESPYHPNWRSLIDEYLVRTDEAIGTFLSDVDPASTVIVMSDHGSGPMPATIFRPARWLEEQGLLTRRHQGMLGHRGLATLHRAYRALRAAALPRAIRRHLPDVIVDRVRSVGHQWPFVDMARTRVYPVELFFPLAGFEINLAGRQPHGIVTPDAFERERDDLMGRLRALMFPGSTRPLFRRIQTREELFSGPFEQRLPDVVAELEHDTEADLHFAPELFAPNTGKASMPYRGYHMYESVFVMAGPGIPARRASEHAHLRDFVPTILRLLDVPVPADRHGRFLPDLR